MLPMINWSVECLKVIAVVVANQCHQTRWMGGQTLSFLAQGEQLLRQARGLQLER